VCATKFDQSACHCRALNTSCVLTAPMQDDRITVCVKLLRCQTYKWKPSFHSWRRLLSKLFLCIIVLATHCAVTTTTDSSKPQVGGSATCTLQFGPHTMRLSFFFFPLPRIGHYVGGFGSVKKWKKRCIHGFSNKFTFFCDRIRKLVVGYKRCVTLQEDCFEK